MIAAITVASILAMVAVIGRQRLVWIMLVMLVIAMVLLTAAVEGEIMKARFELYSPPVQKWA